MRKLGITLGLLLAGVAVAQAELPGWDWSMLGALFDNVLFMAAAVVGLVNAVRKWQPRIDGPVIVPATAVGIGAVVGAVGQLAGQLTATGFTDITVPWGGILYGVTAALAGTVSLNVIELVGNYITKGKSDPQHQLVSLAAPGLGLASPNLGGSAVQYIVDIARQLVPANKVTRAIEVVAPLIKQVIGVTLTDELRAELQGKVHKALRDAKLISGKDL